MNIEEVELQVSIPTDKVGIVLMHSKVDLSDVEPYKWKAASRATQIENIKNTVRIAGQADHEASQTHFTVFPEYSVPGLEGINEIDNAIRAVDWKCNSIVIAGIDGLSRADYSTLCSQSGIRVAKGSKPENFATDKWINCFILWAKASSGQVNQFIQSKIAPAWPEQAIQCQQMHCGSSVFLFNCNFDNGQKCRFMSLICYDWIGKDSSQNLIIKNILKTICEKHNSDTIELHWLFVLKENRKPSHDTFLTTTKEFFGERSCFAQVNRDNCAVVFANNAGIVIPGECDTHGHSSLVFSPLVAAFKFQGLCPPSYSGQPKSIRDSEILSSCHDVIFRENGSCIHSFSMHPPKYLDVGGANKFLPLIRASVHPLRSGVVDPRVPGAPVPGIVKWINDKIESISSLGDRYTDVQLADRSKEEFKFKSTVIKQQKAQSLLKKMKYAFIPKNEKDTPDDWTQTEEEALNNVLDTLTVFGLSISADVNVDEAHAVVGEERPANLIAIKGESHLNCRRYIDQSYCKPPREELVLVSRDKDNSPITNRERRVTDCREENSSEAVFTDPASGVRHLDFSSILCAFKEGEDEAQLKEKINELLGR